MKKNLLFEIKELYHLIGKAMFMDMNLKDDYKPTATQVRFIDFLSNHEDNIVTGKLLEEHFHISKATVSDVLNTMEKHKIIIRTISKDDTRVKVINLNKEFKKRHETFNKEVLKMQQIVTNNICNDELKKFNEIIGKMKDNVGIYINKERNDSND
jgi:DNA-binding MarR family transcriptional regulator